MTQCTPDRPRHTAGALGLDTGLILAKSRIEQSIDDSEKRSRLARWVMQASGIGARLAQVDTVGLEPQRFLEACAGFLGERRDYAKPRVEMVSPWRVLGARYARHPIWLTPFTACEVVQHSEEYAHAYERSGERHPELISLAYVPALELYVPLQGRNRVYLFQRYHRPIPAVIDAWFPFPSPQFLRLTRWLPWGVWELHYDGHRHTIPFRAVAALLRGKGIPEQTRWTCSPSILHHWRHARRMATSPHLQVHR